MEVQITKNALSLPSQLMKIVGGFGNCAPAYS